MINFSLILKSNIIELIVTVSTSICVTVEQTGSVIVCLGEALSEQTFPSATGEQNHQGSLIGGAHFQSQACGCQGRAYLAG